MLAVTDTGTCSYPVTTDVCGGYKVLGFRNYVLSTKYDDAFSTQSHPDLELTATALKRIPESAT